MDRFAFDDDYVRRLREHDARTEQHFYDVFYPRLFSHLRKRVASMSDVEDLRQETFRRVLQKIYDGELREEAALFGFVFRVSDIVVLEHYRKRVEPIEEHDEPAYDDDPIDDLITRETKLRVQHVLDEMQPRDAEVLRAIFIRDVPREVVARELGVTDANLRVVLHRALIRFAEKFQPDDETNRHGTSLSR
jgi:RNA polymerase sigma-70 factor (ECF subfamily)